MIERILTFIAETLGTLLGSAIILAIGAFVALVFWNYWGWFVVPIGAPQISFFHSWGLVAMVGLLVPAPQLVGSNEEIAAHARKLLLGVAIAWPFGFCLHLVS